MSKTIATILATAIVGAFTFLFVTPTKSLKSTTQVFKTSKGKKRDRDNLFI